MGELAEYKIEFIVQNSIFLTTAADVRVVNEREISFGAGGAGIVLGAPIRRIRRNGELVYVMPGMPD